MGTQGERPCPRCDRYHMGECAPAPETRSVEGMLGATFSPNPKPNPERSVEGHMESAANWIVGDSATHSAARHIAATHLAEAARLYRDEKRNFPRWFAGETGWAEADEANRQLAAWKLTAEKFQGERDKARERLEAATGHINRIGAERTRLVKAVLSALAMAEKRHFGCAGNCLTCDMVAALLAGSAP